jgi:hypothetical protein
MAYDKETQDRINKFTAEKRQGIARSVAMNAASAIVASVLHNEREFSTQEAAEWTIQLAKAFTDFLMKND